jgi:hypothetical protein
MGLSIWNLFKVRIFLLRPSHVPMDLELIL